MKSLAFDTETTGLDIVHGAMPFIITTYDGQQVRHVEWDVNPLTRQPVIPQEDVRYFQTVFDSFDLLYAHNSQFDVRVLAKIGIIIPWHKVRDSFVAAHLLESNGPHNLTDCCTNYIHRNIEKYELDVKAVVKECRNIVKRQFPKWRLAKEGEEDMPSVSPSSKRDEDKPWKNDMWLPRALALALGKPALDESCNHTFLNGYENQTTTNTTDRKCLKCGGHFWFCVTSRYANADSVHTLPLGLRMEQLIQESGYWKHYLHRLELMEADCEMVSYGTTVVGSYTEETIQHYTEFCAESNNALKEIAEGYNHELDLAKGASINDNMRDFFYGSITKTCHVCGTIKRVKHWNDEVNNPNENCPKCLKGTKRKAPRASTLFTTERPNLNLPVIISAKTGNATLDGSAMQEYLATQEGDAREFIKILTDKRKHETDLMYMQGYKRFWIPCEGYPGYYRIHCNINPCGSDHLRQTSNSPNLQNVGGQEEECDDCEGEGCELCNHTGKSRVSNKRCFGPLPNREWYCADYRQIENRLPPYFCGEEKMIEVFEKPDVPPYWGSLYLQTASVLYPDEYWPIVNDKDRFRTDHKRLYKQAKFFNLAKQYGAGRKKGDLLSKVNNSYDLVDNEFPKLAALQAKVLIDAQKTGYVQTIPSRGIDPERGYPILASRTEDNYVLSTTPFNYFTSGTACECKNLALVRCVRKCAEWRREGFDAHVCLEVHDELVFDFPKGPKEDSNLWRALELKRLMEQSGQDLILSIPTPVKLEYNPHNWAEGRVIA